MNYRNRRMKETTKKKQRICELTKFFITVLLLLLIYQRKNLVSFQNERHKMQRHLHYTILLQNKLVQSQLFSMNVNLKSKMRYFVVFLILIVNYVQLYNFCITNQRLYNITIVTKKKFCVKIILTYNDECLKSIQCVCYIRVQT